MKCELKNIVVKPLKMLNSYKYSMKNMKQSLYIHINLAII